MALKQVACPVGRPKKDEALVLRDQYWTLWLKQMNPGLSLAALELKVAPHTCVRPRDDKAGSHQPFALYKAARGKRGLTDRLDQVPDKVAHAEHLVPGATRVFRSVFWRALIAPLGTPPLQITHEMVAPEVTRRLSDRHFMPNGRDQWKFSIPGLRRLSRLHHRDAVGLLLMQCPKANGIVSNESVAAEHFLPIAFINACRADPALNAIAPKLTALIAERFRVDVSKMPAQRRFPRTSGLGVAVRMLLGP